jgi:hypothetical protein
MLSRKTWLYVPANAAVDAATKEISGVWSKNSFSGNPALESHARSAQRQNGRPAKSAINAAAVAPA